MVGAQQAVAAGIADQFKERTQALGIIHIRYRTTKGRQRRIIGVDLGQDRPAQPLLARAQADQPQVAVDITLQQRRQLGTRIGHRREGRDHQRDRADRLLRLAIGLPLRLHRQRVLADRDGDIQRRAQFHAHCLDRLIQPGVLARVATGGHPVGRQLDRVQRIHRRGAQVGDRLAHRHARGGGRVEQRQRGALANGHRLTGVGVKAGQGDGHIRHRHLPRADHLLARGQPTHAAVTDGDQEVLGCHARVRQHPQAGLVQVQAGGGQGRPARG